MKALLPILLICGAAGCFPEWRGPSAKLASQADNYMDNMERDFFSFECGYKELPPWAFDSMENLAIAALQLKRAKEAIAAELGILPPGISYSQYYRSLFSKSQYREIQEISDASFEKFARSLNDETRIEVERDLADFISETVFPSCRKMYENSLRRKGLLR